MSKQLTDEELSTLGREIWPDEAQQLVERLRTVLAERDAEKARADGAERALALEVQAHTSTEKTLWSEGPDESVGLPGVTWRQVAEAAESEAAKLRKRVAELDEEFEKWKSVALDAEVRLKARVAERAWQPIEGEGGPS